MVCTYCSVAIRNSNFFLGSFTRSFIFWFCIFEFGYEILYTVKLESEREREIQTKKKQQEENEKMCGIFWKNICIYLKKCRHREQYCVVK